MTSEFKPIRATSDRLPDNDYEALMMAKPFEEPQKSNEELLALRDAVASIVDELEPRDLWIINACISEGKSLQKIADELGITKTHVWRLRNQALDKLREVMMTDTTIRQHVRMADTWEQSATQWVMYLGGTTVAQFVLPSVDSMRQYIDALEAAYREPAPLFGTQQSFERIAAMAIQEMRTREEWDPGYVIATLCKKQHDYGHGNINRFGIYGVIVRLSDKIERLDNLNKIDTPHNESKQDTLLDVVGYCVIALMLMDNTFNLELGDDYGTDTGHN